MKPIILSVVISFLFYITIQAQAVYVDCNIGNDSNSGDIEFPVHSIQKAAEIIRSGDNDIYIMKINPGIYVLDKHISVATEKPMTNKRIVIEASILPDDSLWTPEKMPVITCKELKGNIAEDYNFVASFLVDESHVTIRGFNFHGYFYSNTRYFPVCRFNLQKSDLLVEQCMFIGDENASHIQVGVIAHGDEVKVDHCVFYNAKNAAVFWADTGKGDKTGNSFTNCIVSGAFQCAVWFAWPDKDFIFKNNIITKCKHAFIKNGFNSSVYSIENSVLVNNKFYQGVTTDNGVIPGEFEMNEVNIIKKGDVSLKMLEADTDAAIPTDYLHVIPNTLGYDLRAGLFKN
jgi:hypothetical protein